jgi:transcriptional regulator with XRE-family HTH domain
MEDIAQRIHKIINDKHLSPSEFADNCGLKRPLLSHILSGRNKPSLQVVLQILESFTDVNTEWLLFGKSPDANKIEANLNLLEDRAPNEQEVLTEKNAIPEQPTQIAEIPLPPPTASRATIQKLILLYSDGTFETFDQNK